jgi:hypothetical protein
MFALKFTEEWLTETFVLKGQAAAAPDIGSSAESIGPASGGSFPEKPRRDAS